MDDIIKVHIWELPEKINDIDKINEYCIIHDGVLKKIKVDKLYEYFNQDYKIDNIVRYFEEIMYSINNEYTPKYLSLEVSLTDYEELVKELVETFKVNRDNIRRLESISGKLDNDINDIKENNISMNNKSSILLETLNNFSEIVSNLINISNTKDIDNLNKSVETLIEDTTNAESILDTSISRIEDINNRIDKDVEDKKEVLLKNINDEYDKILAIVDYYHHIHEQEI